MTLHRTVWHDTVVYMRDLADQYEELTERRNDSDLEPLDEVELEEFTILGRFDEDLERETGRNLRESADNEPTMVADNYWSEHAREYFDDVNGDVMSGVDEALQSYVTVDYDSFARDLQYDYTPVTFDGDDYWIRAY